MYKIPTTEQVRLDSPDGLMQDPIGLNNVSAPGEQLAPGRSGDGAKLNYGDA